jgi:hypothetical protein
MMIFNRINRSTLALIAANLAFSLVVMLQLLYPATANSSLESQAADDAATLPEFGKTTLNQPRMADLPDMLERPLFFVARRMPEPEVQEAAPPPTPLRLKLEGIAIAGGSRVAVLRNLNGNGLLQLAEGETHEGWTLDSLTSTTANFSRGTQQSELLLDPGSGGARR